MYHWRFARLDLPVIALSHQQRLSPALRTSCCLLISLMYLSSAHAAAPFTLPLADQAPQRTTAANGIDALPTSRLYLQTQFGVASESDFGPALAFYYERPEQRTNVTSLSVGRYMGNSLFGWPADIVAFGSIQHFGEGGFQPDAIGAAVYIKAYREIRLGQSRFPLRLGLGEGLSYASRIPIVEVEDFAPETSAKLINYLEWTLQTSLNHLLGHGGRRFSAGIKTIYIGYSIFHRSTVFGLFGSKGGGVNYMGISMELVLE